MSATLRLLRFLHEGDARAVPLAGAPAGSVTLRRADGRTHMASPAVPLRDGLAQEQDGTYTLTPEGRAHLARAGGDVAAQHRVPVARMVERDGRRETASANAAESPLARLRYRSDRAGRTWLGAPGWATRPSRPASGCAATSRWAPWSRRSRPRGTPPRA